MSDQRQEWDGTPYPELIRSLPEIDVPIEGVRGWLLTGSGKQAVFFDILPSAVVPPHSHCDQWGLMVDGEMSLTIGDETKTYRKGDSYYIPEGVVHSAKFITRVNVIDVFDSSDRYSVKK
jgi:quercetin dioxygenase-like cupin family protein